jgi:hypothetical protein
MSAFEKPMNERIISAMNYQHQAEELMRNNYDFTDTLYEGQKPEYEFDDGTPCWFLIIPLREVIRQECKKRIPEDARRLIFSFAFYYPNMDTKTYKLFHEQADKYDDTNFLVHHTLKPILEINDIFSNYDITPIIRALRNYHKYEMKFAIHKAGQIILNQKKDPSREDVVKTKKRLDEFLYSQFDDTTSAIELIKAIILYNRYCDENCRISGGIAFNTGRNTVNNTSYTSFDDVFQIVRTIQKFKPTTKGYIRIG